MWRDDALVLDIMLAAQDALDFAHELDLVAFQASKLHQSAVIRCIEVIGEAAGRVSPDFQSRHPEIPWRMMADMRNRLIHGYAEVRIDVIWRVLQEHLPALITALQPIVPPDQPAP